MNPDEKLFFEHLDNIEFQLGVQDLNWGIYNENKEWPYKVLWIKSKIMINTCERIDLLFDLDKYPSEAPTSCPWDIQKDTKLIDSEWPKGNQSINTAFNPKWKSGVALYIPCDRVATNIHGNWKEDYPDIWWTPDKTITHYIKTVYRLLN
jgi:hypothetical protein